jgi:hypothetical protein
MIVSGEFPNGIRSKAPRAEFFVSRGSDNRDLQRPVAKLNDAQALAASDPKIITR